MKEIRTVAVMGAGAVGSYVIWGLSQRNDIRLGLVAQGERAERLQARGCAINGESHRPQIWSPDEARAADLLVIALKYGNLPGALDDIEAAAGRETIVMSLMNGVDSEDIIATRIPRERILPAFIKVASHKEADGYHFDPATTIGIIFGEAQAPFESERVRAVCAAFAETGMHYHATNHIREEMWSKFRLNVCNNLPQAIIGAGVGCYRDSAHMRAIQAGLRSELEAIAAAKGIDMNLASKSFTHGSAVPPTARYSTLQDLDAGRHTEVDMFSGALMRMSKELGIATPYNDCVYHLVKALEEKNDGLFDYKGEAAEELTRAN